jgi:fatty-acyl-CoA synthase
MLVTEALLASDADGGDVGDLPVHRGPHSLATLICTSGSSGAPKAVMLSDAVWARRVHQPRGAGGSGTFAVDSGGSKLWVSFQPPFHTMNRKSVWECIFVGGRVGIHQDAQGMGVLWKDFQELQPDRIVSSPAFWKQLHRDWEMAGGTPEAAEAILARLGGRVHSGSISGAKPPEAVVAFMRDQLGFKKPPKNNYSSSEAHLVLSNGLPDARNGVSVKLADVPGMYSVAAHGAGELLVSSPSMLSGYFGNQDATDRAFDVQEGVTWYRTGDIARVATREDGSVALGSDGTTPTYDIVDRVSNVVKMASGEFVNPADVEAKLGAVCSGQPSHFPPQIHPVFPLVCSRTRSVAL